MPETPDQEITEPALNRVFRCGVCGVTSPDINVLKLHIIEAHVNQKEEDGEPADTGTDIDTGNQEVEEDGQFAIIGDVDNMETEDNIEESGDDVDTRTPEPARATEQKVLSEKDYLDVDLNFKVKMPKEEMAMFPKHIQPALYFTCSYCDFKHNSFKQVSMHISENHPKKLDLKLREKMKPAEISKENADVTVVNNSAYLRKQSMKRAKTILFESAQKKSKVPGKRRTFSCAKCNTKCDKEIILDVHKRCHIEGSDKLRCCFCGKNAPAAKAWYGLFIHMVNKHSADVPAPLSCDVCKKGFVKLFDLQKHLVCHSSDRPHRCNLCSYTFKYKRNLHDHGILKHKLGTEQERVALIKRLRARPKPEMDENLPWLQCTSCSYKTKTKSKYNVHVKIHTGVKDICCQYCDYKTGDRSALRRHEWRHREIKPFSCKFCSFTCIQRPQIHAHYKNKHAVLPDDAAKLVEHINGSRHYNIDDEDLPTTNMAATTTADISGEVVTESNTISIHGVDGDTTVELDLLTVAAEGLLAASQIEHTT